MPINLVSPFYQFHFTPEKGVFDLVPLAPATAAFSGGRMRLEIQHLFRKLRVPLDSWTSTPPEDGSLVVSPHGQLIQAAAYQEIPQAKIQTIVTFALSKDLPLFLWKLKFLNLGDDPVWLEKIEFLRAGGQADFGSLDFPGNTATMRWSFFSNGWQSWSHTGTYLPGQSMRISRLGFLQQPMAVNHGTPALRLPGYYTSDFYGAVTDLTSGAGLVAGFLSQKNHFGTIEGVLYDRPSLAMFTTDRSRFDPGAELETDWAVLTSCNQSVPDPFGVYLDAVAREHNLETTLNHPVKTGWCSWYRYYTNVTDQDIRLNLNSMDKIRQSLPLDLVQIDDGFETRVGDWFSFKPAFQQGVAPLAKEISDRGFTPGLWLAPFILDRRSQFYRDNPQYILRNRRGKPVNAGFGWNSLTAAIDLTVPGAMEETCQAVHLAASEWGFPYLKLDFLYAAALPGFRYDPTRTRAQIMRAGMQALRDAAGADTCLLGCGLPLGSGLGLVDAMRIGADVSGAWQPQFHGIKSFIKNEPHMPAARNAIQNTLSRAPLHNRWWVNDPDCLLVGPDTQLTEAEVQTLATVIGLTGGSMLLSDDLASLPPERMKIAQVLLPGLGKRPEVLDLLEEPTPRRLRLPLSGPSGEWTLAARFNWQEQPESWVFNPADYGLPDEIFRVSSFWDQSIHQYQPGSPVGMPAIPPHGAALLAIYPAEPAAQPAYLGSNLHFSQGNEVTGWEKGEKDLQLELGLGRTATGFIRLFLPHPPMTAVCEGKSIHWTREAESIYLFDLSADKTAAILIHF